MTNLPVQGNSRGSVLITNIEHGGKKEDTEQLRLYGYRWPIAGVPVLEDITSPLFCDNAFINAIEQLTPYALTRKMTSSNASEIFAHLQKDASLQGITFTIKSNENEPNTKSDYYIYAKGKAVNLHHLPAIFTIGPNRKGFSTKNSLRQLVKSPFMIYQEVEGKLYPERLLTLEEYCALPTIAYDSEAMFWEKQIILEDLQNSESQIIAYLSKKYPDKNFREKSKKELITLVNQHLNDNLRKSPEYAERPSGIQIAKRKDNNVNSHIEVDYYTLFGREDKTYFDDSPVGKKEVHVHGFSSHLDRQEDAMQSQDQSAHSKVPIAESMDQMIAANNRAFQEHGYVHMITVNGSKYDLIKLREHGLVINGKKPVIDTAAGFFPRTVARSLPEE